MAAILFFLQRKKLLFPLTYHAHKSVFTRDLVNVIATTLVDGNHIALIYHVMDVLFRLVRRVRQAQCTHTHGESPVDHRHEAAAAAASLVQQNNATQI